MHNEQDSAVSYDADLKSKLIRSVGTHRTDRVLTPVEVAHALDYFSTRESLKVVAQQIDLESSTANRFLRLLSLPSSVQSVVDWGASKTTLSFSAASELASLESTGDQEQAARLALRHKMTKDEVRQAVQIHRRAAMPINKSVDAVLARRPQVVTLEVFIGAIPSSLKSRIAKLSQSERDSLLFSQLQDILPRPASVRMTPQHYTITTEEPLSADLTADLDDLVALRLASHFND